MENKTEGGGCGDVYWTGSWVMLSSHGSPTGEQPCGRGTIVAGSLSKSLGGLGDQDCTGTRAFQPLLLLDEGRAGERARAERWRLKRANGDG